MSNRPKDPKNARNKNILVIGGSGSGKTRFFCKPNIMQLHSSYVITDPKGSLICEVGQLLQRAKYRIAVLNTINFSKSMHYNPFAYLRTEKDILKLVNTIIVNTKGEGAQSTEDFWVKAERLYYTALIGYIHYEAPEEERSMSGYLRCFRIRRCIFPRSRTDTAFSLLSTRTSGVIFRCASSVPLSGRSSKKDSRKRPLHPKRQRQRRKIMIWRYEHGQCFVHH